jgi:3-oxoacyl-[acyl-carrier-protein] synthase II
VTRRVVVTGVGMVSSLGLTTQATWEGLLAGRSGVARITHFDPADFAVQIAAEVRGFDPIQFVDKKDVKKMDVFIQYAIAASQYAVDDAGLAIGDGNRDRVGVFIASGIGGFSTIEREHRALLEGGPRRISPFFIPAAIINLASGQVSIRFGARGPNSATCTACSASAHAVGDAYEIIKRGDADAMIAGGSEAAITPMGIGGFAAMRALSTRNDAPAKASRPFDRDRDGFVVGEGSGVVLLEEYESARRRGARMYAEIIGYGMSGDAFHITAPSEDGDGAVRAMQMAIRRAGVEPSAIDYINAHGTSTPYNDRLETIAIKKAFGDHAYKLAISSTKSMTGHLLGAAGGLEAAITALAIHHKTVPPTVNLDNPDPDCDLDYVANVSRTAEITYALSNSFGFGGTNAVLLFQRVEPS